jgi:hypothetical protein
MRKLLLTSALVAGFASSAFAHAGPTVTLGGSLDTQLGVRSQKSTFDTLTPGVVGGDKLNKFAIVNDSSIHVKADGKAGNGLKYGGMIEMSADTSNGKTSNGSLGTSFESNSRKTSAYVESMFGRLEVGSTTGVYNAMKVSGASVARATGGIDGDWKYWVNPSVNTVANGVTPIDATFVVVPALPSDYATRQEANAAKVNYMTPSYMGFKAGLTYIPDIEQHGSTFLTHSVTKNTNVIANTSGYKNVFSGGLHYAGKVSNVGLKASLLGETGDAKDTAFPSTAATKRHDLRAWEIGGSANVSGFTLAASYGDWGKSGVAKAGTVGKKKTNYWTVGGSYDYGSVGASVTYMQSKRGTGLQAKATEHSNVAVGLDYKLAPGFMPYAEVSFFKLDTKAAPASAGSKNDGSVFLAGTKLSF